LDEAYNLEILEAEDGRIEYTILFRNIKSIIPQKWYGSIIKLKTGGELDSRDIDENNAGL